MIVDDIVEISGGDELGLIPERRSLLQLHWVETPRITFRPSPAPVKLFPLHFVSVPLHVNESIGYLPKPHCRLLTPTLSIPFHFLLHLLRGLQISKVRLSLQEVAQVILGRAWIRNAFATVSQMPLQQQVVSGCDMVVFIRFQTLPGVFHVDFVLGKTLQNVRVNRHRVNAGYHALEVVFALDNVEPGMFPYIFNLEPFLGVSVKDASDQVFGFVRHELRHLEVGIEYLLVQTRCVRVFKRQIPTDKREQYHSTRPNVHTRALVLFACDHFWSRVARRTTCCFKQLALFVSVRQSEVHYLDAFVVV